MRDSQSKAFKKLEEIKRRYYRHLMALYQEASGDLLNYTQRHFASASLDLEYRQAINRWSRSVAAARNDIIADSLVEAAAVSDDFLIGAAIEQYGFAPNTMLNLERMNRAQVLKMARRIFSSAEGSEMTALSKNWWKWGFSHKNNRRHLLNMLARNASIHMDAVKAGDLLVRSGLIQPGRMPKYLQQITKLAKQARAYNLHEFKDELYKIKQHVKGLGFDGIEYLGKGKGQATSLTSRAFKKRFLADLERAVESGKTAQITEAVKRYSERQAIMNARTLQRSATNAIFQRRTIEHYQNAPYIETYQWTLSPIRAFEDICDDYAKHDEGYGEGNYKPGNVPMYPHYNCACTLYPNLVPADVYWNNFANEEVLINAVA